MTDPSEEPAERGSEGDRDLLGSPVDDVEGRPAPGGPVIDMDDDLSEEAGPRPECGVDGCHRDGDTPKKMPTLGSDSEVTDQYVCRYHRILFLGVRAIVAVVILGVFLMAYLQI